MDPSSATPLPRQNPWWRRHVLLKTSLSSELSGAVGDLGTFIPIVLTLTLVSHLDLSTTLIFTSLYNISTGLLFGVPMPVQPMKSIAAVAVSELPHLTTAQIATAGATTAATLLILGATGLMSFFYSFIPLPVVRGVQLSQGLSFAFSAIKYIRYNQDFIASKSTTPRSWLGLDGLILAISAFLFLVLTNGFGGDNHTIDDNDNNSLTRPQRRMSKRLRVLSAIPSALIVFLFGLVLCFIRHPSIINDLKFDHELSATKVSVSVGVMNLVGCWFGAMPVCHGAGGLAGQYRFGARSGASVVFLGIGKLAIGLVFGNSFVKILSQFPIGILGVLLLFSGIELAMASKDMNTKEQSFVMLVCAAVSLTGSSAALGFGCGILLHLLLKLRSMECSCFGFSRCSSKTSADEESALIPSD
ncbi:hypothetical protein GH714_000093 [Hevea brasiliensis]|uniref:SLC26A/SulP transporter domain-containing protein n=1 Tax=Hevea brasiliensis TaxID=3981 RepID=A0A6A6LBX6_HEVBR|nr:hypothetical protein GH714_000093 [Hevea brasiliensis]